MVVVVHPSPTHHPVDNDSVLPRHVKTYWANISTILKAHQPMHLLCTVECYCYCDRYTCACPQLTLFVTSTVYKKMAKRTSSSIAETPCRRQGKLGSIQSGMVTFHGWCQLKMAQVCYVLCVTSIVGTQSLGEVYRPACHASQLHGKH